MSTQYREVKRKANVGERIRIVRPMHALGYGRDDEGEVKYANSGGVRALMDGKSETSGIWHEEYVVLEPVAQETLDFPEELTQSLAQFLRENAAAIRKYLDNIDPPVNGAHVSETAALTRAEVIAKALADVAELERIGRTASADLPKGTPFQHRFYNVEFHVNREKRAVTALIRTGATPSARKPNAKATAKTAPGDVFHAEIGKAIALRRALGLTVPDEYANAPKPDEPRVGAKVRGLWSGMGATVERIESDDPSPYRGHYVDGARLQVPAEHIEIIDDTDVDYEGSAA